MIVPHLPILYLSHLSAKACPLIATASADKTCRIFNYSNKALGEWPYYDDVDVVDGDNNDDDNDDDNNDDDIDDDGDDDDDDYDNDGDDGDLTICVLYCYRLHSIWNVS